MRKSVPPQGAFLVVEDDPAIARGLWRIVRDVRPTDVVHSALDARAALEKRAVWTGFFIDVHLGDEAHGGLDVLAHARTKHPVTPALVLTADVDHEVIHRAFALRAEYLTKPYDPLEIRRFVARALAAEVAPGDPLAAYVDALVTEHALSDGQAALLSDALAGKSRADMQRERGISPNTLKDHVRALLRKLDAPSLDALVAQVLRRAVRRVPTAVDPAKRGSEPPRGARRKG